MSEEDVLDKIDDAIELIQEIKDATLGTRPMQIICPHCNGTGTKPGWADPQSGSHSCPDCGGTGYRLFGRIE